MVELRTASPEHVLRAADLRVTRPRMAVISVLQDSPHSRPDSVLTQVRARLGAVSVQAVYDVLHTLHERGVVRRFQPTGSVARYELDTGDNHHHAVCRGCGLVTDVACATGAAPCLSAPEDLGFVLDEAEVSWWGLCAACQPSDPRPSTTRTASPTDRHTIEGEAHA